MDWSKWRRLLREIALGGDPAGVAKPLKNRNTMCSGYLAVDWSKWRRLLRETALGGDPAGVAEEAPAAPLGKRSHLR
ncbi:hypothetical protein AAV98_14480, partial [Bacillus sp. CHD6a]